MDYARSRAGALGSGSSALTTSTPTPVSGTAPGAIVALGGTHGCGVTRAGKAQCWGSNLSGELGDRTTKLSSPLPVDVAGLDNGVTAIAAGDQHSCAVRNGLVQCWGSNGAGQLGDPRGASSARAPVATGPIGSAVTSVTGGYAHTCALTVDQKVWCWGSMPAVGYAATNRTNGVPHIVELDAVAISAGGAFTCAITTARTVKCWGNNDYGQLGTGSKVSSTLPTDVLGLDNVTAIAAGGANACAITGAPCGAGARTTTANWATARPTNRSCP